MSGKSRTSSPGPATEARRVHEARSLDACGLLPVLWRWVEAEQKLRDTPALLKMPSGYVQQNPWLTISRKQLELMHKYMSELGLSPVARTRVDVRRPGQPSKFAGLLGRPKPWESRPADAYLRPR